MSMCYIIPSEVSIVLILPKTFPCICIKVSPPKINRTKLWGLIRISMRKDCLPVSRKNAMHDASCNLLTLFPLLPCTLDGILEFLFAPQWPFPSTTFGWWATGLQRSHHYFCHACFVQFCSMYLRQFLALLFPSSSKLFLRNDVLHSRRVNALQFSIIHWSHQACTLVFALRSPLQMLSSISLRRDAGGTWLCSQTHCSSLLSCFSTHSLFLVFVFLFFTLG